jgi:hypothetical protein
MRVPSVSEIPTTIGSAPFNSLDSDFLDEIEYEEHEYFFSGVSSVYRYDSSWRVELSQQSVPYTVQVMIRQPKDRSRFSGNVIVEPAHSGGSVVWGMCWDFFTANGDVWVGMIVNALNIQQPQQANPHRYAPLNLSDEGLKWEILAQAAALFKKNEAPSPLSGWNVKRAYMAGGSGTGNLILVYLGEGFHERFRMEGGEAVFDGYLPYISHSTLAWYRLSSPDRGGPYGYGELMPHPSEQPPFDDVRRVVGPHDVPVIQMITEAEVIIPLNSDVRQSVINMYIHYAQGPTAGERLRYRRPDSDDVGDRYRLYEIAGPGHSGMPDEVTSRVYRAVEAASLYRDRNLFPNLAKPVSDFPSRYFLCGAWRNLYRWVDEGVAPPRANRIEIDEENLSIVRDEHGNALGGVRSPLLDVPVATYTGVNDGSVMVGAKEAFEAKKVRDLYGDHANYVREYSRRADEILAEGWITSLHIDSLKAHAERASASFE